jgi:hypothetical protein
MTMKTLVNAFVISFFAFSASAQVSTADLAVKPLIVETSKASLKMKTKIWNVSNNNARDVRIVVLISQDVELISVRKTVKGVTSTITKGPGSTQYTRNGCNLVISIPEIGRLEPQGVSLEVTTTTSAPRTKEFAVMAYNKLADGKPQDNYQYWSH